MQKLLDEHREDETEGGEEFLKTEDQSLYNSSFIGSKKTVLLSVDTLTYDLKDILSHSPITANILLSTYVGSAF